MKDTAHMLRRLARWCESRVDDLQGTPSEQLRSLADWLDDDAVEAEVQAHTGEGELEVLMKVLTLLSHPQPEHQRQGVDILVSLRSEPLWRALMAGARVSEAGVAHELFSLSPGIVQALLSAPRLDEPPLRRLRLYEHYPLDFHGLAQLSGLEELHLQTGWGAEPNLAGLDALPQLRTLKITGSPSVELVSALGKVPLGRLVSLAISNPERIVGITPEVALGALTRTPSLRRVHVKGLPLDFQGMEETPTFELSVEVEASNLGRVLPTDALRADGVIRLSAVTVYGRGTSEVDVSLLEGVEVERFDAGGLKLVGLLALASQRPPIFTGVGSTDLDAVGLDHALLADPDALWRFLRSLADDDRPVHAQLIANGYDEDAPPNPNTLQRQSKRLRGTCWVVTQHFYDYETYQEHLRGIEHLPETVTDLTLIVWARIQSLEPLLHLKNLQTLRLVGFYKLTPEAMAVLAELPALRRIVCHLCGIKSKKKQAAVRSALPGVELVVGPSSTRSREWNNGREYTPWGLGAFLGGDVLGPDLLEALLQLDAAPHPYSHKEARPAAILALLEALVSATVPVLAYILDVRRSDQDTLVAEALASLQEQGLVQVSEDTGVELWRLA